LLSITQTWASDVNGTYVVGIYIDNKLLVDQSVSNPDAASITAIDAAGPAITVDKGDWGTEGSGKPSKLSTEWAGNGSVFVGLDQAIVLRNNNKKWVNDFYVTAPEQRIAARKLGLNAKRANRRSAKPKQ
jgi:hypothetical protein